MDEINPENLIIEEDKDLDLRQFEPDVDSSEEDDELG
jgi:hypothetical protein